MDEAAKNSGPVRGRRHSVAAENRPFMRRRIPVSETIDGGQPDLRTAYRHLAEYFPGGAVILHEGRVVLANEAFARLVCFFASISIPFQKIRAQIYTIIFNFRNIPPDFTPKQMLIQTIHSCRRYEIL